MTTARSAYPMSPEVVASHARRIAEQTGKVPSQRRLMRECKVGADKASAAIATVERELAEREQTAPITTLHVVPDAEDERTDERTADPEQAQPEVHSEPRTDAVEETVDEVVETAPENVQDVAETHVDTDGERTHDEPTAAIVEAPETVENTQVGQPAETPSEARRRKVRNSLIFVMSLGGFVALWTGWVGLGRMAGFGPVEPLPGLADGFVINSAIVLPLGVEAYAGLALWTWLSAPGSVSKRARSFAFWSSLVALVLGLVGQSTYHLLVVAGVTVAPWPVVIFVSSLPVLVVVAGAALAHTAATSEDHR